MTNLILALVSGILLVLAFPKFGLYLLAYIALAPLLISIKRSRSIFEAAFCGFICGVIFFSGTLFWINTLSKWAGAWAYLAWISLAVFQALFIAAFAGTSKYLSIKFPKITFIIVPVIWTSIEWIRSMGPYGVTGGGLGYSQAGFTAILQVASIAGVYGISFLIVLVNEAIAEVIAEKKPLALYIAAVLLASAVIFGQHRINSFNVSGRAVNIAIVQANISEDEKLDFRRAYEIVDVHEAMSKRSLSSKPDIIIWPETAVTTYLFDSETIRSQITGLVEGSGAYYLIGTPYRERDKIYNSIVAFSRKGKVIGRYDKQRLVPFGEYLPLRPLIYSLLKGNHLFEEDYNSNPHPKVIDLGIARAGAVICFESTFPYLVRDKVKHGAQFILVATNDAWFFDSAAPYQHIQAAQMRAVENKMYVVQAANTGVSAIIDPVGRVVKKLGTGKSGLLIGKIYIH